MSLIKEIGMDKIVNRELGYKMFLMNDRGIHLRTGNVVVAKVGDNYIFIKGGQNDMAVCMFTNGEYIDKTYTYFPNTIAIKLISKSEDGDSLNIIFNTYDETTKIVKDYSIKITTESMQCDWTSFYLNPDGNIKYKDYKNMYRGSGGTSKGEDMLKISIDKKDTELVLDRYEFTISKLGYLYYRYT